MRDALLVFCVAFNLLSCSTPQQNEIREGTGAIELIQDQPNTLKEFLRPYNGSVVYLDIWASWCGPCLREMPASALLKHKLEDTNVTFLYLSVDEDEQRWLGTVEAKQIFGKHYLATPSLVHDLEQKFGLNSIPRYMIFNSSGQVVYENASRPSDAVTASILMNLAKP